MRLPWTRRPARRRRRIPPVVDGRGVFDYAGAFGAHGVLSPAGKEYDGLAAASGLGVLEPVDASVRSALKGLKRASRVEHRKGGYLRAATLAFRREVIGPGLMLRSLHPDAEVREAVEGAWSAWCADCDVTGRMSWRALLHVAVDSLVVDGEVLLREHYGDEAHGYRIELLDSLLLDVDRNEPARRGRRITMGVEMDRLGRPTAYWLLEPPAVGYSFNSAETVRTPAELVAHCFDADMPGMTRGVPWAFSTLRRFEEIRQYDDAERKAAAVGAKLYGVYRPSEAYDGGAADGGDGEDEELSLTDGGIAQLEPGANLDVHAPQHPNTAYRDYVDANLTAAASALGVSYASLTGDLSRANFVSSRLGRLAERGTVRMVRDLLVERVALRCYRHWLERAWLRGVVPQEPIEDLLRVEFVGPAMEHVQPRETAAANSARLKDGVASRGMVIRESGHDPRDVFAEIEAERALEPAAEPDPVAEPDDDGEGAAGPLASREVRDLARRWLAEGASRREVARRVGASPETIRKLEAGETWKLDLRGVD